MFWTDNNNETNRFESVSKPESFDPAMRVLTYEFFVIRKAVGNVEAGISDAVARIATKEYNQNLERIKNEAETKAVAEAHNYPLATETETKTETMPQPDILHEAELDADEIRARLDAMNEPKGN